jgi:hypothetical protein
MSGLAAGLARGLAGYMQGRERAEQREYERQQAEEQRRRQEARDALLMEQTRLSMEATRQNMARQTAQDGIAAEGRTNAATLQGFRPVGDQWDTFNDLVGIDPSKAETITVNGQTMRKVAPTQAFQQGLVQRREQENALQRQAAEQREMLETIRAQLPAGIRPMAVDLSTAKSLLGKFAEQRMAPPRQESPVSMQVLQTADGPMAFNPRTGQAQPITAGGQPVRGAAGRAQLPTEGERKAAALFGVAQQGYETLEGLLTAGVDPKTGERQYKAAPSLTDRMKQSVGMGVGNVITSNQQRQMSQAAQQMADMWLRYTSGAAVPETEVQRFALTFTPLPGDDPQTLQQKAAARRRMIGALQQAAGRALNTPGRAGTQPSVPEMMNDRPPLDTFEVNR